MNGPVAALLPDGRLHLQHGPIDLVIEAVAPSHATPDPSPAGEGGLARQREPGGDPGGPVPTPVRSFASTRPSPAGEGSSAGHLISVEQAYRAAVVRFATILPELCAELPLLRQPARPDRTPLRGPIARRMWAAVAPCAADAFITPMAAVAGAVAEEVLAAMLAAAPLARASVNNGGDIALHLGPGEHVRIGLVDRPDRLGLRGRPSLFGEATIAVSDPIRGVATSGWRGRSFSLGIADAVTVLARTAAEADAAATIIANAIDLPGHPAIVRVAAREVQCDSDLGGRLVTTRVGALTRAEIEEALASGLAAAEGLTRRGLIAAAALHMQGETYSTSWPGLARPSTKAADGNLDGFTPTRAVEAWMAGPSPAMTAGVPG